MSDDPIEPFIGDPTPTPEGEAAAAIAGHPLVQQCADWVTADMLDEFHGFVQEEIAAVCEEKDNEIAYLRAIVEGRFKDAARLVSAGSSDGKFDVHIQHPAVPLIAAHLAQVFKSQGAENYVEWEVTHEDMGPLVLTLQRRRGKTPGRLAAEARAEAQSARGAAIADCIAEVGACASLDENGYICEKSAAFRAIRALLDPPAEKKLA